MADSVVSAIRQAVGSGKTVEVMQGTVISKSPLKVQMDNDENLITSDRITVVPKHLTKQTYKVKLKAGDKTYKGTVDVDNSLDTGDKVHVLALSDQKVYFLLDRVDGSGSDNKREYYYDFDLVEV